MSDEVPRPARQVPAGDFNYDADTIDYANVRRPEPVFARAIRAALGPCTRVLNVGAGAGSYEPEDVSVTAVEPSASMRAQRPPQLSVAIDAVAEHLPFADGTFDAAMASFTVHQWRDLNAGLKEMRRVTTGPIVILTFDPDALGRFWLSQFAPALVEAESRRMPAMSTLADALGESLDVQTLAIPHNCSDGIIEAFYGRPEAFLDERVRAAQSSWGFISISEQQHVVSSLAAALADGTWDLQFGHLRHTANYEGALRLITAPGRKGTT